MSESRCSLKVMSNIFRELALALRQMVSSSKNSYICFQIWIK